jgi:Bifunctional DNA primase/polymerase, N-terminal
MQTDLGDLPCFPCSLDKRPLTAGGFRAAKRIEPPSFWPLVGVPTGAASGFDVLDIDPDGLGWLTEHPLPTRKHRTPRGWHLLFRHVDGLRCSAGRISRGVDVRAEGGFAVWWPREGYEVVGVAVAEWPEEILRLVRRSGDGSGTTREHVNSAHADVNGDADVMDGGVRPEPTGSVKLRGKYLLLKVEGAQRGNRNNMLHWAACRFGEMIGEGRIKREIAEQLLEGACRLNRLWMDDPREVRATIKSGLDQGIQAWMAWIGAGNETCSLLVRHPILMQHLVRLVRRSDQTPNHPLVQHQPQRLVQRRGGNKLWQDFN